MNATHTFFCATCGRTNYDDATRCSFCCSKTDSSTEQQLREAHELIRHYNLEIAKLQGRLQAYLILEQAGRINRE